MTKPTEAAGKPADTIQYVTVRIAGQLFGLPILSVHDVFMPERTTRVPRAPRAVEGVLNLRGRIVTTINMRRLLDFPDATDTLQPMAVGIDYKGESYGLIIDTVGEVLALDSSTREPNPMNLDPRWAQVADGIHRLESELMVILDVERVLSLRQGAMAA
ncbi:CheW protein [Chelatococcus sambhunathii]|uniref:Chemotaxis protein CheW n=2 Tax=Chelatococcus TaxID=28209 RepID=A0AAC9JRL8_9HYPH|nr:MULTISPECIES: chemotaxis protein CheW [Chelatococcus]APF38444.1 chemotaxis protein CheW [Chelatococcus daeguensis]CUA85079.1 CheW protein [Chelatococcus sambhunathii]